MGTVNRAFNPTRRGLLALSCFAIPAHAQTATLRLRVTSEGRPTDARVYIVDAAGKAHVIPGAIAFTRPRETHSVVHHSADAALAPGRYTLRAERGAEFRAIEKSVDLPAGGMKAVDLDVARFHNMNAAGWYSGDLHIHRSPEEMPLLAAAEDLNIAPVITRHVGTRREPPPFPSKHQVPIDARHIVSLQNQEVERLRTGHGAIVLLNAPEPVDWRTSDLFPLDADFCLSARRSGAFVDGEKPIWKNVPVNVALGALDAIGIVNNHFHPRAVLLDAEKWGSMEREKPAYSTQRGFAQWMIDLYYSFLNCGFRLPVSAGSASGIMPSWPGYERVYVHLSGPFSYEQWFRDLRAGRSIATNGPLLEAFVNGKPPGSAFDWTRGARYRITFSARSQTRLDPVEVIFNGRLLRRFEGLRESVELEAPEPGWLAIRCFEPAQDTVRYAHSSPFYFTRDGRLPVNRADAQRWAEYIARLVSTLDATLFPSRENFDYVASKLRQAERIYRDLK